MIREEVNMVCDNHEVSYLKGRVHTACCVGNKENLYAQFVHHTFWKSDLFHGITFVVVESALHGHDILVAEFSQNELSAMSLYCGDREIGYIFVRNLYCISYLGS